MEPFYIYTYIHIYIYNKVIFQNKKLIPVQSKSERDRVRHFQGPLGKDRPWSCGAGRGQGGGGSCLRVRACVRVCLSVCLGQREPNPLPGRAATSQPHLPAGKGGGPSAGGKARQAGSASSAAFSLPPRQAALCMSFQINSYFC